MKYSNILISLKFVESASPNKANHFCVMCGKLEKEIYSNNNRPELRVYIYFMNEDT